VKERIDITDEGRRTALTVQLIVFFLFGWGGLSQVPAGRERRGSHPKFIVERFFGVLKFCSHNG